MIALHKSSDGIDTVVVDLSPLRTPEAFEVRVQCVRKRAFMGLSRVHAQPEGARASLTGRQAASCDRAFAFLRV